MTGKPPLAHEPQLTRRALLGSLAALAMGLTACGGERAARWAGRYLTVVTTGGALRDALFSALFVPFERATGCAVHELSVPVLDAIRELRRQALVGRSQWDVVVLDAPLAAVAARATPDLFATDDAPVFAVDSLALACRKGPLAGRTPTGWDEVWTGNFPGTRLWPAAPAGFLEIALLADGAASDTLYPLDLDRAFASLDRLRSPNRSWWQQSKLAGSALALGEADLVLGYAGELRAAIDSGADATVASLPSPVLPLTLSLPRGAPNGDVADDFATFARGESAQAALRNQGYGLSSAPSPNALVLDVGWWREHGGAALARFERWRASH